MPLTSSSGESSSPSSGDEPATKKLKELMTTFHICNHLQFEFHTRVSSIMCRDKDPTFFLGSRSG